MFAIAGAKVELSAEGFDAGGIEERPVLWSDMSWVTVLWREAHRGDRLAIFPGAAIAQWFNHSLDKRSSVFLKNGKILGYMRYGRFLPITVSEILPVQGGAFDILAFVLQKHHAGAQGVFSVSLDHRAALGMFREKPLVRVSPNVIAYDAFMLKILDSGNEAVKRYCAAVLRDSGEMGIISFPAVIDVEKS